MVVVWCGTYLLTYLGIFNLLVCSVHSYIMLFSDCWFA